jgi:hypothetical protein
LSRQIGSKTPPGASNDMAAKALVAAPNAKNALKAETPGGRADRAGVDTIPQSLVRTTDEH